ncbi:hypothetical protein GSI_14918 [Ganoderma sinense ZZ0214-1]|uniref:Uncharacterized protein n=1 Tax=Ganoderma sinense ZZ0214-1 TaxID=1077348 RepID=A0A2G8RQ11_9APHY|nr:hypothetical protein GSI_14918 [Ganoderma sinense ZZ0214-1]
MAFLGASASRYRYATARSPRRRPLLPTRGYSRLSWTLQPGAVRVRRVRGAEFVQLPAQERREATEDAELDRGRLHAGPGVMYERLLPPHAAQRSTGIFARECATRPAVCASGIPGPRRGRLKYDRSMTPATRALSRDSARCLRAVRALPARLCDGGGPWQWGGGCRNVRAARWVPAPLSLFAGAGRGSPVGPLSWPLQIRKSPRMQSCLNDRHLPSSAPRMHTRRGHRRPHCVLCSRSCSMAFSLRLPPPVESCTGC